MTYGCVVLPTDLVEGALATDKRRGWFSGAKLRSERVFVVIGIRDGDNSTTTNYIERLKDHRALTPAYGDYKDELLKWINVKEGFTKEFESHAPMSPANFENWTGVPASEIGNELVHFCCIETTKKEPIVRGLVVYSEGGQIEGVFFETTLLTKKAQPLMRVPDALLQALGTKRALIVGLGSGGAEICLNLASAGIGRLDLVDYDLCQPENYFRHISDKRDLGRTKIAAVKSAIEEKELSTEIKTFNLNVVDQADRFRDLLEPPPDLLIGATDSLASRRLVNCCSVYKNVPAIIAGTLDGGRIGEVMIVRPKKSACYECIRLEFGATLVMPESDERGATPYVDSEEQTLEGAAFRSDVTCVAALAARGALGVLVPELFPALPHNYLVWGRDAGADYGVPFSFDVPLGLNYVQIQRRLDCPVCGDMRSELAGIDVIKKVAEILEESSDQ